MAELLKEEGDFTYWDDGSVRYAKGNSLGKQPGAKAPGSKLPPALLEHMIQSADQAVAMNQRKQEKWLEEAQAGMLRQAQKTGKAPYGSGPSEAWGAVVEGQTDLALTPTRGRASTTAARFVGEAVGVMTRGGNDVQATQVNVVIGQELIDRYVKRTDPDNSEPEEKDT